MSNNSINPACIECRKYHLKCDLVSSTKKRDCLNCRRNNVACIVDSSQQKTKKKPTKQSSSKSKQNSPAITIQDDSDGEVEEIQPCTSPKSIDDVSLPTRTINDLFKLFFDRFHPFLPFKLSRDIELVYETSRLLFWTICSIASPPDIYEQLEPHIKLLISQALLVPFRNIETVHALLISSMWPLPGVLEYEETAYISGELAARLCTEAGIARPLKYIRKDAEFPPTYDERTLQSTWHTCLFVGLYHSLRLGEPNDLESDKSYLKNKNSPPFIRHALKIVQTTFSACRVLEGYLLGTEKVHEVSVIGKTRAYLKEIAIIAKIVDVSPAERIQLYIIFLLCHLQLYVYIITEPFYTEPAIAFYEQAEKDAIDLINMVNSKMEEDIQFAPAYITRSIVHAVLILLWVKQLDYAVQTQKIAEYIPIAQRLLSKTNRFEKDDYHKALDILLSSSKDKEEYASLLYQSLRWANEKPEDETMEEVTEGTSIINTPVNPQ